MTIRSMMFLTLSCAAAPVVAQPVLFGDTGRVEIRQQTLISEDGDVPIFRADMPATDLIGLLGEPEAPGLAGLPLEAPGVISTGSDPEGDLPVAMAYSSDGSVILIAHRDSSTLVRVDAATHAFLSTVNLTFKPQDMAVAPDGSVAVLANISDDTATVVDLNTLTEVAIIPVGDGPGRVHISPDSTRAVVGNSFDNTVSVISLATNTVERTISTPSYVSSLSFSFESGAVALSVNVLPFIDNTTILFPGYFDSVISFIDVATGTRTDVATAPSARGVAVSADGSTAAVVHQFSGRALSVIDVATKTITKTIVPTVDLWGPVALNADGSVAAVAVQNATQFVDLNTETFGGSISTASVNGLLNTADGQHVLAVGYRGSLLSWASQSLVTNLNNQVSCTIGAVSPVASDGAMCSDVFGDDLVVVTTNGAAGSLQSFGLSGPPPEGDRCRTSAVSDDGSIAVGVNIFSDNATIFDAATMTPTGWAPTGMRPAEVEISPDGTTAVVANLDSFFTTVIDLATATSTNIAMGRRGSQVEISPDGAFAYVAVVADGDGVNRINLNTLALDGPKIATGNMGSVGYTYSQTSDIKLNSDGSVLAVAGTFTDNVSFIDTTNWSLLMTLPVGDFPTRLTWDNNGTTLYVTNKNDDTISVIEQAVPGVWFVSATIPVGDQPFDMVQSDDSSKLYVSNWGDLALGVIDLNTNTQLATVPTFDRITGMVLSSDEQTMYAASGTSTTTFGAGIFETTNTGVIEHIDLTTNTITDTTNVGFVGAELKASADRSVMVIPSPAADALIFSGEMVCLADTNHDGAVTAADFTAWIAAFNASAPECDQNSDGACTPADFTAWIANFNAGCP